MGLTDDYRDNSDTETSAPVEAASTDGHKRRWDVIPWDGLGLVVDVLTDGVVIHAKGEERHGEEKWRSRSNDYHRERLMRHFGEYACGQRVDPETSRLTLAHLTARALMLLSVEQDQ